MNWELVTVCDAPVPLLTSDYPVIRYKGLKDPDGLLMLPIGPQEFFVELNCGRIDMKACISDSIRLGHFIESMNEYVVQHAVSYVYGSDDTQIDFVARHFPTDQRRLESVWGRQS